PARGGLRSVGGGERAQEHEHDDGCRPHVGLFSGRDREAFTGSAAAADTSAAAVSALGCAPGGGTRWGTLGSPPAMPYLRRRMRRGERLASVFQRRVDLGNLLGLAGLARLRLVVQVGLAAEVESERGE